MIPASAVVGQFSPGPLSRYHEALEGNRNCVKCHKIGKKEISDDCIACHEPIEQRIKARRGYHWNLAENCGECHSEHNGRAFELVYWPKDITEFDHSETGYPLTFRHGEVECRQCHTRQLIKEKAIVSWAGKHPQFDVLDRTFLGLATGCRDCHADVHGGELSGDCVACHSTEDWRLARQKFDHTGAKFRLTGAHGNVSCEKCHPPVSAVPEASMRFSGLDFANCVPCHHDVHRGSFGISCEDCHTTADWKRSQKPFDHGETPYPLVGKHKQVDCGQCHASETGGKPLLFGLCSDCHGDAHYGQLSHREDKGECQACHHEGGFSPSLFTLAMHQATRLALDGAHIVVPCNQCHTTYTPSAGATDVKLRWPRVHCQTCHEDYHRGQFAQRMKGKDCTMCHGTADWRDLVFSHDDTDFPLEGKHATITCESCHKRAAPGAEQEHGFVLYAETKKACADCHRDIHGGQFQINRGNRCGTCHSSVSWETLAFDHNTSRFPLEGKHENVSCPQCHSEEATDDGRTFVRYYPVPRQCADCHLVTDDLR